MKSKTFVVMMILLISVIFVAGCNNDPQEASLQVKDDIGNPVSGAIVTITQNGYFGTYSVIGSGEVESSGLVKPPIPLNKDGDYLVTISYNGTQETQKLHTSDAASVTYSIIWQ
jgi:hypothetical protein